MKSTILKASVFTLALDISVLFLFLFFIFQNIEINTTNFIICTILSLIFGNILFALSINLSLKKLNKSLITLKNDSFKLSKQKLDKFNLPNYDNNIISIPKYLNTFLEKQHTLNSSNDYLLTMYKSIFDKLEQGILLLNAKKEIIMHNISADKILGNGVSLNCNLEDSNIFFSHIAPMLETFYKTNKPSTKTITLPGSEKIIEIYISSLNYDKDKKNNIIILLTDCTEIDKLKKTRDEFASNVTHELKTPLTSIIGYIELLSSEERDAETRKYFYDIIYSESQKLFTLIDDMLLLSQVENMNDSSISQKCNVKKESLETIKNLAPLAEKRNIKIELSADSNLTVGISDIRMQQLFSNIIGNAIKYNVDNGNIYINIYKERKNVIISIKDTGIGINPQNIDKIFERFYRSDVSRASGIPGTGLGLAIVKDIVKLYNGDIQVKSEQNKGSEFIVTFPLFNR